jgi:hypothetical protein
MTSEPHPGLDRPPTTAFATVAENARVARTMAALEANGISVLRAASARMTVVLVDDALGF